MAISNGTYLANLVNPQVMADMIEKKLTDLIRFSPLATIDNTLEGRPGSVVTLPCYSYIGDAGVVSEGEALTVSQLTASTTTATIHKIAKGVTITDEAVLSGFGDPVNEAVDQIALSIASKVDAEVLAVLAAITGTMLYETASTSTEVAVSDITAALEKFGEDIDGEKVVLVCPSLYTGIRAAASWLPASEIAADRIIKGAVGEIYGCQVIVSNKLTTSKCAYIVKPGALRYYTKRDILVESDRDITTFATTITASKHGVAYLYDTSKAIKLAKKAE